MDRISQRHSPISCKGDHIFLFTLAQTSMCVYLRKKDRKVRLPNRVASPQSDPLRNWSVLLLRLCKLLLGSEGFVALLIENFVSVSFNSSGKYACVCGVFLILRHGAVGDTAGSRSHLGDHTHSTYEREGNRFEAYRHLDRTRRRYRGCILSGVESEIVQVQMRQSGEVRIVG